MINIIIYKTLDGDIVRCVYCLSGTEEMQCGEGEAWIEHEKVNDAEYKVDLETLQVVPV